MILVPLHATGYWMNLLTQLFIFGILASAWNIIGGYTGYAAFGNVAFFGGGAYVTAELMTKAAGASSPRCSPVAWRCSSTARSSACRCSACAAITSR